MKNKDRKSQRKEKSSRTEERKRESQKKEETGARNARKVAKHCVFPPICGSGGLKRRLAKAAGEVPSGAMRNEKLHAMWRAAHVQLHGHIVR